MRNLADKAYELSMKCNLKEEARLIQAEERKLANYQRDLNTNVVLDSPDYTLKMPGKPVKTNSTSKRETRLVGAGSTA